MARAKICDLCQTYYKPYNEDRIYPNTIELITCDSGGYSKEIEKYDLCPDCLLEIGVLIEKCKNGGLYKSEMEEIVYRKFNLPIEEVEDEND